MDFIVRGTVKDSVSDQPLPRAHVRLITLDSSVVDFQLSEIDGRFTLRLPGTEGTYTIIVSYLGYQTFRQQVRWSLARQSIDLGAIRLSRQTVLLEEVNVVHRSPITIRNDTTEFDVQSFSSSPQGMVEEVVKKLPSVELSSTGAIMAQGQTVQQILVDGKPFFSGDLRTALRNLPANLIDKIQIFDKQSDQASFSGIDDGSRKRTINLITKPAGRNGVFGQQVAGLGSGSRFQSGISVNKFRADQRLSIIGQANNINQSGYSLAGITNQINSGGGNQGPSNGISQSAGGGINYSDKIGKRINLTASYLVLSDLSRLSQSNVRQITTSMNTAQADPLASSLALSSQSQLAAINRYTNHSLTVRINYQINARNIVQFQHALSGRLTSLAAKQSTETLKGQQLLNQSQLDNSIAGSSFGITNTLLWMHRFSRVGQTISLEYKASLNDQDADGVNKSQTRFYDSTIRLDSLASSAINQRTSQRVHSLVNDWTLTYTQPISAKNTLAVRYQILAKASRSGRGVTDADQRTGDYIYPNEMLSNRSQNELLLNRLGSSWQGHYAGYSYTIGLDIQQIKLDLLNESLVSGGTLQRQYINLLPSFTFQPKLSRSKTLQIQYQTQVQAPNVLQLQPIANVTNPLYIQLGNPALRPEYTHLMTYSYSSFQASTGQSNFALLSMGLTQHRIVNAVQIDSSGVQTIVPVNSNGYSTLNGSFALGQPIKMGSLKAAVNLTTNLNLIHAKSLVNEQPNYSVNWLAGQLMKLTISLKSGVELGLSVSETYQKASYSLQTLLANQSLSSTFNGQLNWPLPAGFRLAMDLTYSTVSGRSTGYNQRYILWNGYISRSMFKSQQAEVRLQVCDLLNQNRSLARTVTDTYIEDTQSLVLKRYIMLNLIYNLRQFKVEK